ncbi:hypothetical protein BGX34_007378, partial [Mortierella sp. NVP85]
GRKPTGTALQARQLALEMYNDMKRLIPDLDKQNVANMPLSIPQSDMAVNIHSAIRQHFGELPMLVVEKLKRMKASTIPEIDYVINPEDGENDEHSIDEEDGSSFRFKEGHLKTWWLHWKDLPDEKRPVFCPAMGFGDVSQLFQESAIVSLLWGDGKNHPTRSFMEAKLCTHAKAKELTNKDYGALLHMLFVGDAELIKNHPQKKQTSYGKRTTTMSQLASMAPDVFGVQPMQDYVDNWFRYVRQKKESAGTSTTQPTPPHLPTAPHPTRLR